MQPDNVDDTSGSTVPHKIPRGKQKGASSGASARRRAVRPKSARAGSRGARTTVAAVNSDTKGALEPVVTTTTGDNHMAIDHPEESAGSQKDEAPHSAERRNGIDDDTDMMDPDPSGGGDDGGNRSFPADTGDNDDDSDDAGDADDAVVSVLVSETRGGQEEGDVLAVEDSGVGDSDGSKSDNTRPSSAVESTQETSMQ